MCPNRRPLRPQQPIFGTFLRGDLHFGRHTTSSADLTATRLGELHDMRVQHAGDTLCDDLVSCKPPTTGGVEGAGRTYTRPERQQARKNSPSTAPLAAIPRKNSPNKHKTPNLGCFQRAGRTFSRFRDHTTPQGELFRAQMKPTPPLLAPSRARMKPATPLLANNAAKSSISCEQRCQRFQPTTNTGPQRCQRFQPGKALHRRGR